VSITEREEEAFKKGYERCRLDMARELGQLIAYYYNKGQTNGGDALRHASTVLRAVKPGQKPWNPDI